MNRAGVACGVLVALVAGGVAQAHWTGTGSGTGQGSSGTTVPVVLTPGTPSASLHPGGRADVVLTMTSANPTPTVVEALVLDRSLGDGGYAVDEEHPGCLVDTFSFDPAAAQAGWTVPGRSGGTDGTLDVTLSGALSMGIDAADACQGATVTVYLKGL